MAGPQRIPVTGGAGFTGSALVRHLIAHEVRVIDTLTYAGSLATLASILYSPRLEVRQTIRSTRPMRSLRPT